jgi:branched-chain amino acid transport system permease protein
MSLTPRSALITALALMVGILASSFFLQQYYLYVAIECLLFGLFAMSLDIIVGYAGIVSFGHAAFFGLGAYATGLTLLHVATSLWAAVGIACGLGVILSLAIGSCSMKARGVYFAIVTLAFAEIMYRVCNIWLPVTGGSDGLFGFDIPKLSFPGLPAVSLEVQRNLYYFVAGVVMVSYLICWKLINSPFGWTMQGIRENEERVRTMGYNVEGYKITAFAISAFFATLAGALYVLLSGFASPDLLYFVLSGQVLIMVIVGGMGTLIGPLLGGIFFTVLQEVTSTIFAQGYFIIVGLVLILMVLFLPGGLASLLRQRTKAAARHAGHEDRAAWIP